MRGSKVIDFLFTIFLLACSIIIGYKAGLEEGVKMVEAEREDGE